MKKQMAISGSLRNCLDHFFFKDHSENEELLQSLVYKHASSDNSFGFSSLFDLEVQKIHAGMKSLETHSSFGS